MNDPSRSAPLRKRVFLLRWVQALVGATLLASTGVAAGAGILPIDLGWVGPASCPASDDLQRDVRRFLGDAPVPATLPPIAARVSIRETDDHHFEVRMVTTSGAETRERALSTATCDEARDLVAFLLALLIDPNAHAPTAEPAPQEPAPVKKPPAPAPVPSPPRRRATEEEPGARFLVGLAGSGELGTLPGGSAGAELRAGLLLSAWSVEASGTAWLPRRAESSTVAGVSGRFSLLDARVVACLRGAPFGGASLQVCAGPALLLLRGSGYGVRTPGHDEALLGGASAEAAVLLALTRSLSLRPAVGALLPFRRPTFAIHDVGAIHRPSALSGRAVLGVEARL